MFDNITDKERKIIEDYNNKALSRIDNIISQLSINGFVDGKLSNDTFSITVKSFTQLTDIKDTYDGLSLLYYHNYYSNNTLYWTGIFQLKQ
jgi:hypothetical protein